jgi:hypothetical protein
MNDQDLFEGDDEPEDGTPVDPSDAVSEQPPPGGRDGSQDTFADDEVIP